MATPRQITDFMMRGTIAARPVSPSVAAGEIMLYFATDTLNTYIWDGSGWVQANGGLPPTIVQSVQAVNRDAMTLGAAPTQGNLMLGLCSDGTNTNPNTADGWATLQATSQANDNTIIFRKYVGSGQSATQDPNLNSGTSGTGSVIEVANCGIINAADSEVTANLTHTLAIEGVANGLIIGAIAAVQNTNLPTLPAGCTQLAAPSQGSSRSITLFKVDTPITGSNSIVCTYGTSTRSNMVLVALR